MLELHELITRRPVSKNVVPAQRVETLAAFHESLSEQPLVTPSAAPDPSVTEAKDVSKGRYPVVDGGGAVIRPGGRGK